MTLAAAHASLALSRIRGFYGMVDLAPGEVARAAPLAAALLDGGATVLQLRMKRADARELLDACAAIQPLTRDRATFIVNDRLDVALAVGADGAHLGQTDLPLGAARRIVPAGFILGLSTHNAAQAKEAAAAGADYLGFGPVFGTVTKENPDPIVGTSQLAEVCRAIPIPIVAIGGITLATIDEVAQCGAAAAAVIAAVNKAPDIAAAARQVTRAFTR